MRTVNQTAVNEALSEVQALRAFVEGVCSGMGLSTALNGRPAPALSTGEGSKDGETTRIICVEPDRDKDIHRDDGAVPGRPDVILTASGEGGGI